MPKTTVPDTEILQAALAGLQQSLVVVNNRIAEIRHKLGIRGGGDHSVSASDGVRPRRNGLSAAARRRIAAAQKKRWAAYRKAQKN